MEFFKPKGTINFMKYRGVIPVSLFLAFLGIVSVAWPGPNYGIDFKGWNRDQLKFGENVTATDVRKTLERHRLRRRGRERRGAQGRVPGARRAR